MSRPRPREEVGGLAGGCLGPDPGGGWGSARGGARLIPGGVSRPRHALRQTLPPVDGYCCGRYPPYWNVFLFLVCLLPQKSYERHFLRVHNFNPGREEGHQTLDESVEPASASWNTFGYVHVK